jgi:exosortase A-associated hydrolase 1
MSASPAAPASAEEAIRFSAEGHALYGILHLPRGRAAYESFLLMVVGGPQDRTGSHRSFVTWARGFAAGGIPVLRFDYVGIGDSEGEWTGYAYIGPSIKAAIDFLYARFPSLKRVVIWSLCDGSAACSLYAPTDPRIGGLILSNPFVHSPQGQAKAFLKHYYLRRLTERDFWRKVFSGRFNPFRAAGSLREVAKAASGDAPARPIAGMMIGPGDDPPELPKKVMEGLQGFRGPLRLILSSADLTAQEFLDLFRAWVGKGKGPRGEAELRFIEEADHTFTRAAWKARAGALSLEAWKEMTGPGGKAPPR